MCTQYHGGLVEADVLGCYRKVLREHSRPGRIIETLGTQERAGAS
jgi:hypothetical protein